MAEHLLEIRNLHARVEGEVTDILRGVDLAIRHGEMHALMGPNGSGKSTLAKAIAGHPGYEVTSGEVLLDGENVLEMEPDERSRAGLFLAFQYPAEIPGVSISNFLRTAMSARLAEGEEMDIFAFQKRLMEKLEMLKVDPSFAARYVNDGFSGGEKKRNEILQLAMLEPRMAVMDETDSGLDIDALRIVSEGVNTIRETHDSMGVLLITHYKRILNYLRPDYVHVMLKGQIAHSGGPELADRLEEMGYDWLHEPEAETAAV
ncbi:MAG: Fe-S cluster assembly ATPase SufC [Candidatus Palauibacterales bacterium]|jgi:Fe-S cluster assembly ATP-binding protein|nr:Fe-S cluster assembly ATPase SufC [Candidatus Palauibacterales bacterium]MDP2483641.1 Fe-S cluster assembly ATPase SufC [Candidatus Palauibacterales bacterium]